jgi:hypothetical protein
LLRAVFQVAVDIPLSAKPGQRTIYRLGGSQEDPAFKVGGTWRFSRATSTSWIKQQSMEGLDADVTRGRQHNGQSNDGERK